MGRRDWTPVGAALLIGLCLAGAGRRATALSTPSQFCTGDPCVISSSKVADPNITLDFGTRTVILQNTLTLKDLPGGGVGALTIKAGSFSITGSGQIKGFSSDASGGSLTVQVSNAIQINSTISSGAIRLSGQDAGSLTLSAGGPVTVAGRLAIYGDGIVGSGGSLSIDSDTNIVMTGELDMHGGLQGSGGDIDLSAGGDVTMSGFVDLTGGDVGGGFFDISAGGSFTLGELDMSGSGEAGDAGFLIVDVGGDARLQGAFRGRGADNGEDCGDGADVDISALGDVFITADMDIRGRGTDCSGGSLALDGASVFVQSTLQMGGTGLIGGGGTVDITATTLIRLTGRVDLDGGQSGGGDVSLLSDRDIEILGQIYAVGRSATSPGGAGADLIADKITVSGTIDTSAGSSLPPAGPIGLTACDVITTPSAVIRALGDLGSIAITANDVMRLRGQFRAASNGGIALRYGPTANPPDIVGASFVPAATSTLDPTLLPCRVCGANSDCADGNPCTDDVCDFTQCLNPPLGNSPCEDGDECTVGDFCAEGICISGPVGTCNDADQDGRPDATDECTTLIWTSPPTSRPDQNPLHFLLNLKRVSAEDGEQSFLIKGSFNPAPSQPLLIDPAANGLHLSAEDADGQIYDVSLPGGAGCGSGDGWTTLGIGFKKIWVYRNESNAVPPACTPGSGGGVSSVQIKDKRIRPKGGLQFKIKGKSATLLRHPTEPLTRIQVSLGLGARSDPGVATAQEKAGQCCEALFTGNPIQSETKPYCRAKVKQAVLDGITCKGP
jgi:hypothetical protein